MSIRFTTSLSLDDFMSANWLILRRYFLWLGLLKIYVVGTLAFVAVFQAISLIFDGMTAWSDLPENAILGVCYGLAMVVIIPIISVAKFRYTGPRRYREVGTADLPIDWEMDAEGYRAANSEGSANLSWNRLQDFSHDRRSLIFAEPRLSLQFFRSVS